MKRKDLNEIKLKELPELNKILAETQKSFLKLKMEFRGGKIKDVRILRKTRDDLARIMTIIKEKTQKEEK